METTIEGIAERYEHWADQLANRWDKPEEHIPFKEQIKGRLLRARNTNTQS